MTDTLRGKDEIEALFLCVRKMLRCLLHHTSNCTERSGRAFMEAEAAIVELRSTAVALQAQRDEARLETGRVLARCDEQVGRLEREVAALRERAEAAERRLGTVNETLSEAPNSGDGTYKP